MMNKKAVSQVVLAGILWGLITVFVKYLSANGLTSMNISLVRMAVAAPGFALFIAVKDIKKLNINIKDIWMFIGTGIISVTLFNCSYFYTMIHSQASIAVVLLYTSPVFIMIMSAILFKERITSLKIIALILTFCGCVLVAGFIGNGYKITPLILLTGLASGLFYGLYTIFGTVALKKYDTLTVTVWTFFMGLIGSLIAGNPAQTAKAVFAKPGVILMSIGIGVICTILPYFFYTAGLRNLDSGKAAILVAVEPLVGAVIGMTFYHENKSILKIIGIAFITIAIIILNLPQKPASKNKTVTKS